MTEPSTELTDRDILARAKAIRARNRAARQAARSARYHAAVDRFTGAQLAVSPTITLHNRDARELHTFISPDVDLVFFSPPYNVGVQYATHDDRLNEVEYLQLVRDVLVECGKVMVPGARIGVVVPFGLGRDPWEPLAGRVQNWLQMERFTLLGQVIWDKGEKVVANRTAWGSYRSATAPRFRDRTEAIVWAYKERPALHVPDTAVGNDAHGSYTAFLQDGALFRKLVQDVWSVSPDAHSREMHPAAFPPELAERAIRLFAYPGAHVLDPMCGSGSTLVAAQRLGCRGSGVEIDKGYCALAAERLANDRTPPEEQEIHDRSSETD